MKKLLVHAFLFVGSTLALGLAASAQSNPQYRVNIPFDFQAAGVQYSAGEYAIGPLNATTNLTSLAIRNVDSGRTRLLGSTALAGDGWKGKSKMVFVKADGVYTLSEILTPRFEFTANLPKRDGAYGKAASAKTETETVGLK